MSVIETDKSEPVRRVAMVGDKVKVGEYGNVVYTVLERYEVRDEAFVLLANFDKGCARSWLFDLVVVEYSPMHKLQIMKETFGFVTMGSETPNWVCFAHINLKRAYVGEGATPDEAINACWDNWKQAGLK